MALFGRKKQEQRGVVPPAPPSAPPPTSAPTSHGEPGQSAGTTPSRDWADIDAVRAEWPQASLSESTDLASWQEGVRLYDNDDYPSMMRCAASLAPALAHSLYGEGLLRGSDLPETVHKIFYASLTAPPDGRTFADVAQKAARLALTITRENGWHPAKFGGQGLFDHFFNDQGNTMLLMAAIAPPGQFAGDLRAFFAVPPTPLVVVEAEDDGREVVDRMYSTLKQAEAGDEMSEAHMRGMSLWANGQREEALQALSEAAQLGSAQAMKDAGDLAQELGRGGEARFWFESAANAGNAGAMWNMGLFASNAGDLGAAASWYQRAAEAGHIEGYAALSSLAFERGDRDQERHWARLGAEAGFTWCMGRYGTILAREADGDVPTLRKALAYVEAAGDRGDHDSISMAAAVNSMLGDNGRARMWADRGRATGDPELMQRLDRHGF